MCLDFLDDRFLNRLRVEIPSLFSEIQLQGEMSENPLVKSLEIPFLRMAFLIDILRNDPFDHLFEHLLHIFPERLSLEDLFALFVDDLPLAVHDVVIFQQVLADIEILPLDTLLGILDRLGNQPMLDRLSLFHADPVHDGGDPLGAEDPAGGRRRGRDRTATIPYPPAVPNGRGADCRCAGFHVAPSPGYGGLPVRPPPRPA